MTMSIRPPLWRAQKSLDLPLRPTPEEFAK